MDSTVAAVVLPSLITGVLTYFATRVSSKANLEQTNIENAKILYEKLNLELETKVDELEASVSAARRAHQEEIIIYQAELAKARSEQERLAAENRQLKETAVQNQQKG
ncbi:hypothetical protein [Enterococcus gallinarum]